ncbi:hypothetical protein BU16DRAFT_587682 [Lophium mytilinum]|uniref:Uncharacterized protein n=1 Tax=Lophium mytilinum TaxID=390894 RepID=A0A6A6RG50_9PEZI|nr:hypothetical protein BU16DRAFT_587682 [Lophium mytilinum]
MPMAGAKRGRADELQDELEFADLTQVSEPKAKRQKLEIGDMKVEDIPGAEHSRAVARLKELFPSQMIRDIHQLYTTTYQGDLGATLEHLSLFSAEPIAAQHGQLYEQEVTGSNAPYLLQHIKPPTGEPPHILEGASIQSPAIFNSTASEGVYHTEARFHGSGSSDAPLLGDHCQQQKGPATKTVVSDDLTTNSGTCTTNASKPRKHRKRKAAEDDEPSRVYDFMKKAPHQNHPLPSINVTLVEILVLLGHAHLNYHVANRLVTNGLTYPLHQFIVRCHRTGGTALDRATARADVLLDEDDRFYSRNSILHSYQHAFRAGKDRNNPVPGWTFTTHKQKISNDNWDPQNISLAGIQVRGVTHCLPDQTFWPPGYVMLESLLNDVDQVPSGDDAADLTKAVLWAKDHPGTYKYPADVELALSDAGGPVRLSGNHFDGACIARWNPRLEQIRAECNRLKREAKRVPGSLDQQNPVPHTSEPTVSRTHVEKLPTRRTLGHANENGPEDLADPYGGQTPNPYFLGNAVFGSRTPNPTTGLKIDSIGHEEEFCHQTTVTPNRAPGHLISNEPLFENRTLSATAAEQPDLGLGRENPYVQGGLLRDLPYPPPDDNSVLSRCIRFSKHPSFYDIEWANTPDNLDAIVEILEQNAAQLPWDINHTPFDSIYNDWTQL